MAKIAILGTGAWGTALANILLENGNEVYMWGVDSNEINDLNNQTNARYFGNKTLVAKPTLATQNIQEVFDHKITFVIIAVPSVFIVSTLQNVLHYAKGKYIFINVAKGLDPKTNDIWSKSIKQMVGAQLKGLVTLIGPSFATEVFKGEPTMVNAISTDSACSRMVSLLFNNHHFKCVTIKDEVGAEIIGALKNVAAIAMGLAYELHTSINTRAAMLAEATKEINNVVKYYGGQSETITQFCGIGDIYLTCTDEKSRNFSFGKKIASIGTKQALLDNKTTIEGYYAAEVIYKIINKAKMKAPIFLKLHQVLFENGNPKTFVKEIIKEIIE